MNRHIEVSMRSLKVQKNITIRLQKKSDFLRLKKLTEHWYWPMFKDKHYATFVAEEGKTILGVAVMSITLDTANLDFIFVNQTGRSLGIGAQLLRSVEKYAARKKADGLGVNCGHDNKGARRFYKREGFRQVGRVWNYFSNKNWQVFYWKKIS